MRQTYSDQKNTYIQSNYSKSYGRHLQRSNSAEPYRLQQTSSLSSLSYPRKIFTMNSYRQQYSGLSSSYHQDISFPKNITTSSNRYGSIDRLASLSNQRKSSYNANFPSNTFTTKRSISSGTKLNDIGATLLRRYDNDHPISAYERRTSYASSHYSTSGYVSSYGTLPRYNRSQTPSYINRERNYATNREYKSMSRFSTDRERSVSDDNVKQRLDRLYNRYARDQDISNNHSSTNDIKFPEEDEEEGEGEEELSHDENELKDVLRDIAKLNEHDMIE
ncbi:unnamed protein product, partial [Cercopithifilaria johnstoni]